MAPQAVRAAQQDIDRGVQEYNAAMQSQDRSLRLQGFARAEQLFRQAVDSQMDAKGAVSTDLLVNLGNSALQAEHLGNAIVAYRRALENDPGHARAQQNLQFVRSLLPDAVRIDQTTQLLDTLLFWKSLWSRGTLSLITASCFFLAAVLVSASWLLGMPWLKWVAGIFFGVWLLLWGTERWGQQSAGSAGVVVVDDALLRAADSENAPLRAADPLPDGTELRVLERRDRWLEVEVAGRSGWLNASHVELL